MGGLLVLCFTHITHITKTRYSLGRRLGEGSACIDLGVGGHSGRVIFGNMDLVARGEVIEEEGKLTEKMSIWFRRHRIASLITDHPRANSSPLQWKSQTL